MTVLYSLTLTCSECGADVETAILPMFDAPTSTLVIDPRPLNAHVLDEHGQEPLVDPPPSDEMLDGSTVYDDATPGALYVPPPGTPDPTVGDPLPDPDEVSPGTEEDPTV
jgi:hypothetical protein